MIDEILAADGCSIRNKRKVLERAFSPGNISIEPLKDVTTLDTADQSKYQLVVVTQRKRVRVTFRCSAEL